MESAAGLGRAAILTIGIPVPFCQGDLILEDNSLSITSFVIRFVHSGSPENTAIRGSVLNVQTNEEVSFRHWEEAVEFIRRYVPLMPGYDGGPQES